MRTIALIIPLLLIFMVGCDGESPTYPSGITDVDMKKNAPPPHAQPAGKCVNVTIEERYDLGWVVFDFTAGDLPDLWEALVDAGAFADPGVPPFEQHFLFGICPYGTEMVGGLGAKPKTVTIAGITGEFGSIITHVHEPGHGGTNRFLLFHLFVSDEGDNHFVTVDQAVGTPSGRVNTQMDVIAGTGVFENASGKMINNGTFNFGEGWLQANIHGRICGDGL